MNATETKRVLGEIFKAGDAREAAAELKEKWAQNFAKATSSGGGLSGLAVTPREPVIGKWFKKGDLGFICGARGLGKTWLAMLLARKCAEGGNLGGLSEWAVNGPRRVLYVDGEMPMDATRERDLGLAAGGASGMFYLHHEALFHHTGEALNLADLAAQAALLDQCKRDRIEILFLDNLSCLFSGMRENDADAWEQVLPWLLDLRRNRIAVVFVAHSGRNGMMRGTSRREDAAFWIINLSELRDAGEPQQGAKFIAKFMKCRNATETDCPSLEWRFIKSANDPKVRVTWKRLSVQAQFQQCLEAGLTAATEIAKEMCVSKGQVSKLATKAITAGWLRKDGREYMLASDHPMADFISTTRPCPKHPEETLVA